MLPLSSQVRCVPYMGPGDFDDALASHAAASLTSARHARIRATLANIATSGRKRMRRNLLNHEGTVDRKAVLAVLSSYMFNYNTVESSLLFSAVRDPPNVSSARMFTARPCCFRSWCA